MKPKVAPSPRLDVDDKLPLWDSMDRPITKPMPVSLKETSSCSPLSYREDRMPSASLVASIAFIARFIGTAEVGRDPPQARSVEDVLGVGASNDRPRTRSHR